MNDAPWSPCDSPYVFSGQDGSYTLRVRAKDAVGQVSPIETFILHRDRIPPTITIQNPSVAPASSKTISATMHDGISLAYVVIRDGITCDNALSYTSGSQVTFSSPADNGQRVCFRAADAFGNLSFSVSDPVVGIVLSTPPVPPVSPTPPSNPSNSSYSGG